MGCEELTPGVATVTAAIGTNATATRRPDDEQTTSFADLPQGGTRPDLGWLQLKPSTDNATTSVNGSRAINRDWGVANMARPSHPDRAVGLT